MTQLSLEELQRILGPSVTDIEASALADWYSSLSAAVAAFPPQDLTRVEPPLRSTPGPRRP